jgi:hypothetical protein
MFPAAPNCKGRAVNIDQVIRHVRTIFQRQLDTNRQTHNWTEEENTFAHFVKARVIDSPEGQAMLDMSGFNFSSQQKNDPRVCTVNNKTCISLSFIQGAESIASV